MPYESENTTAIVEGYLMQLAKLPADGPQDAIVRELLGRAVGRLHMLCATLLFQRYPRFDSSTLELAN